MYQSLYKKKLTTPENAVGLIHRKCNIAFAMAVGQPPALLKALADRARAGTFEQVDIYYMHAEAPANNTILSEDILHILRPHPAFMGAKERELAHSASGETRKVIFYEPNSFSQLPNYFRNYIPLDSFLVTVSPMDKAGFFTLGTNNDYSSTAARTCKNLIVEVNENMPRVFGESQIHVSEVAAIVENTVPLLSMAPRPPKPEDEIIGKQIATLIPDGATVQFGVGGVPDAVCSYLKDRNDMGIHSELLSPGMVDLVKQGNVTGVRKNINPRKHVFTLAFGDKDMYDFMDDNPSMESYPVDYVNNPTIIAKNDRVVSVNAIIEIDLFGQVNAEWLNHRQFGGPGGQNDFVRGAYMSKEGKSVSAFESTAAHGKVTKIVPQISGVVTDLRSDTQYVVTEYGAVNLKGLSSSERANQLIELAHPSFRDELKAAAKKMYLV